MKNKIILFLLISIFSGISWAQENNHYKYVVVPDKFDFLKEPDQYQLNSLTKFLFEKLGLPAFLEGEELPAEFTNNRCEGLFADVSKESNLLRTKLLVKLKDCNNRQVFVSEEGISREKDFKESYHEALRDAFSSVADFNFSAGGDAASSDPARERVDASRGVARETAAGGEVGKDLPTQNPQQDDKPQTREEVVGEEAEEKQMIFERDNGEYFLEPSSKGYNFFQKGMAEPFAALIKSSTGDTYIYSSITSKGMAYFDEEGNLVVEILDPDDDTVEKNLYKLRS